MSPVVRLALALATSLALASCGGSDKPTPLETPARPPADFVGIVSEDAFAGGPAYRARALDRQRSAGVRLVREAVRWNKVERSPGRYDLSRLDGFVRAAARRRLRILPILVDPPSFRSSAPRSGVARGTYPPRDPAALGRFGAVLVGRYGPDGSLWRASPRLPRVPIRAWQVWNEPNLPVYWASGPDPAGYARLLQATATEIKRADPHAEVVSAGLSQTRLGMPFADFVRGMYRAGAGKALDTFALHPYAHTAAGVLEAVRSTRRLLRELGGAPPIWITEFGWASGGPSSPFTVGERSQARLVETAIGAFAGQRRELGIRGAVYYDWRDASPFPGSRDFFGLHTGLLRADGRPKPALSAFEKAAAAARR